MKIPMKLLPSLFDAPLGPCPPSPSTQLYWRPSCQW